MFISLVSESCHSEKIRDTRFNKFKLSKRSTCTKAGVKFTNKQKLIGKSDFVDYIALNMTLEVVGKNIGKKNS